MPRKTPQDLPESDWQVVRVLFIKRGEAWVAQCLEHDIAAQGKTFDEAEKAWERTFLGQILLDAKQGKEPLKDIKPAPRFYWRKFHKEGRQVSVEPTITLPMMPASMVHEIKKQARVA